MKKLNLKDIQQIELSMLLVIDEFCRQQGLRYYLVGGTLLGAIRHKGFIPWDDDVDIMIPAEQIERFKKFFIAEAPKEYFIADACSEKYSLYSWIKIRNTNTTSMPVKYKSIPINWGICIDIFPIYRVEMKDFRRALFLFNIANKMLSVPALMCEEKISAADKILAHIPLSVRRRIAEKAILRLNKIKNGDFRFDGWELISEQNPTKESARSGQLCL